MCESLPSTTCSVPAPTPTLSPSFLLAQAVFEPNLFPYEYHNISQTQPFYIYLPMKMEQTVCSEMSTYKTQMLGNYPEESVQHSEHSENLKSRYYTMMMIINF
jgi:hypothetical protein